MPFNRRREDENDYYSIFVSCGDSHVSMVCTRLNTAPIVRVVSSFPPNPSKEHWEAVKWIFIYLRGTFKLCLIFGRGKPILEGFTGADIVGDLDGKKSTYGYLFAFTRGALSWQSKLQKCVTLSITKA